MTALALSLPLADSRLLTVPLQSRLRKTRADPEAFTEPRASASGNERPLNYFVGPHHLVVFVLQHVAMADIAAFITFELYDNACDHKNICPHRVFPPRFMRFGRNR